MAECGCSAPQGVAFMRRHRREGGVQCRVGSRRAGNGLSVAAGCDSRSPSEVKSDDQAINPARGGEGAAYKE